ncbi:hypothetical protein CDQ96_04445 (plasmid) [Borrelia miyamotoi]|uniref:DUF787 family protein n=1 Tax=Borrelia miyamotoi TaxID=47466 RepID=UPI000B8DA59E|nr:DUF787 family protein [Borrelia miyamotoi]ASQ29661.1 hypothetical protein CDQ96_04445 [Borrelia miyamotoi]
MPQDTISVNLIEDTIRLERIGYYNPLLIYKSDILSEGNFIFNISNFEESINSLAIRQDLESDAKKSIAVSQREFLLASSNNFFEVGGLRAFNLCIYEDIGTVIEFLKKNIYPFVAFIDDIKEDFALDYNAIKSLTKFIVFSIKSKNLPNFLESMPPVQRDGIIIAYDKYNDNLHLKFTAKYLHEASIFHAVNPYGMTFKTKPIYDATLINELRKNNINFYSLLNETGRDGVLAFKEGVDLSGMPIDEAFTYYLLKNESTRELIRIWNSNNRQNSKLSQLRFKEGKFNAYTAGLECLFKEFKERGLIISFGDIRFKLKADDVLGLGLSIRIKYNDSFKSVILNINSDDIKDYLRKEID